MTPTEWNNMFELFDPSTGIPVARVRYRWIARALTSRVFRTGLDYARAGEGW